MPLANTSITDGIAVVIFATVIFLIIIALVTLVRWISRLISGRPKPGKMEAVVLVLETELREEGVPEDIRKFILYLHSLLKKANAGYFAELNPEESELHFRFEGVDADRIWELLKADIGTFSPKKPHYVILERTQQNGGILNLKEIPWNHTNKLGLPPSPELAIPKIWLQLSRYGRLISISGFFGLVVWRLIRMSRGETENEFVDTLPGMILAYLVGITLVAGLFLGLISSIRIRALTKAAGFPSKDSYVSTTLKYVFLIVIAIFASVFFFLI